MQYQHAVPAAAPPRPSSANTTSDEMLLALIAKGDRDALRVLFGRHHVRVFRFLLRVVHNEETAQDLLNEVFIEVWRGAARFEARSQATTWISALPVSRA